MKVQNRNPRVIKTLRWFKKATLRVAPFSKTKQGLKSGFGLTNGFDGTILFIEASTLHEAWQTYLTKFKFYDKYIPENSFLRQASI